MALTKAEIEQLPSVRRLSEAQRTFVTEYVLTNGDRDTAALAAFSGAPESLKRISYAVLGKPHIRRAIDEAMGIPVRDQWLRELDAAIGDNKLTMAQVHALVVKGKSLGLLPLNYEVGTGELR